MEHIAEEDVRLDKIKTLRSKGINPYVYTFRPDTTVSAVLSDYPHLEIDQIADQSLTIAGRMVAKRGHGKASFGNVMDDSGDDSVLCVG